MTSPKKESKTMHNNRLLLQFLKGSKALFGLSICCSALTTLVDMMTPQVVRLTIDNAIGGKASQFPAWVDELVERLG
ncbi:MAG: hypothetical protein IJS55_04410, partial [Oscillospiraceae bacterium]|nr:hypothetical protein [Oscillospiraceae bacterium]